MNRPDPRLRPKAADLRLLLPGLTLGLAAGILLSRFAQSLWPAWAAAGAALLSALVGRGRIRRIAVCALAAALALPWGYSALHPALPPEGTVVVSGVITEEMSQEGRVRAVLRHATVDGESFRGGLYWTAYVDEVPEKVTPGVRVSFRASLYHPDGAENPGGFDFREYLLQKGVTAGLYGMEDFRAEGWSLFPDAAAARIRRSLENQLTLRMGEEAGGLVSTMLLGSRSMLPQEERESFKRLGIAHILSVSGFHVAVLAAMLGLLMRRLRPRSPLRLVVTGLTLALYCLLTGFNPPVVRASLMAVLTLASGQLRRHPVRLHAVCAAAFCILLFHPAALFGASFQLSFSAVLALVLISPTLERLVPREETWRYRLWQAFCASVSIQLGILIPQLYWYGSLPLFSLPVNLVLLGLAPLLLGLFWIALFCLPIPLVRLAAAFAARCAAEGFLAAVRWAGSSDRLTLRLPRPNLVTCAGFVLFAAALCCLWRLKRKQRLMLALPALALVVLSLCVRLPHRGTEYIQLSVGSADAAILWDQDSVTVIDAGETGEEAADFLRDRGLSVDTLIITHLHRDHAGGIAGLIDAGVKVRRCFLPEGAGSTRIDEGMLELLRRLLDTGTVYGTLRRGDSLPLPSGQLSVLWPPGSRVRRGADANDYSLVMMLETHGVSMMLTGDISGGYESYLLYPADLLKVAHHGSSTSTTDEFLAAVRPQALILSCGDRTRPAALRARTEAPVWVTEERGAITVVFSENSYVIRGMRE